MKLTKLTKIWLVLVSLVISSHAMAALLVTDIAGKAEIDGKGAVTTLAEISDGTQLTLAAGAKLVAVDLLSGREYILQGSNKYIVAADGPKTADGKLAEAKSLPAKNLPQVKVAAGKVAQATLVMRSMRKFNVPVLYAPARTTVISTRPQFQWGSVEGATSYRLILTGQDSISPTEFVFSGTEHTPAPDQALAPGTRYSWRIEAVGVDGRTISDASANFSVAPADVIKQLEELKPAPDAPFGRRVLYAAQLRQAGAIADARELWKALGQERPDDDVLKSLAD